MDGWFVIGIDYRTQVISAFFPSKCSKDQSSSLMEEDTSHCNNKDEESSILFSISPDFMPISIDEETLLC